MQITPSLLQATLDIARQAGNHLKTFYQQSVAVQRKSDNTPVTEADLFVSHFLIDYAKCAKELSFNQDQFLHLVVILIISYLA